MSRSSLWLLSLLLAFQPAWAQPRDPLADLLAQGLQRELQHLNAQEVPPYHLLLRVDEVRQVSIGASFGALTDDSASRSRLLNVQVRVGDRALDNTRAIRGEHPSAMGGGPVWAALPLEDRPEPLGTALWSAVDAAYQSALEGLAKVRANTAVKVDREDASSDFSEEPAPTVHEDPPLDEATLRVDRAAWAARLKAVSALFRTHPGLNQGNATLTFTATRRYLLSSDGLRVVQNLTQAQLNVQALHKAADGMDLPAYRTYSAFTPAGLPDEKTLLQDARALVARLQRLSTAPVVEPYSGPALLSGRAAGVFFHEIFGHRVEGHRMKNEDEGQTFGKRIGSPVLPEGFAIGSDPALRTFGGQDLSGHYRFDDEGVRAAPVTLVEGGVLRAFLMSRSPIQGFSRSNGHGRSAMGYAPVSRQSNLMVSCAQPLSPKALRAALKAECRKAGKPFGLRFEDVTGGFTLTGRTLPNAFNVTPLEVYKVYLDGRPDELVRGVDLVGTPLVMFSHIKAAGTDVGVFNGVCGAESGWLPVACVAPSLLVGEIEVQKQGKGQDKPPLLLRPGSH